ncbi:MULTISPECIES: AfsR/SARP family transcriptional regulator [Catenuloplanes]|uniref:DNA-binding SARP family transcriptional activator n=1 Tax=Catenuloplanes niger TaxID=587534 RepID=A0AAE3ZWV3_9ACTN|nr:BTAD domain-containing putative transcriptional regulator [Catenuloplanes niger]MDR7327544.1 DNA-binding SARP family transcriptional activator [Catenuloplanes niger]
MEFKLLGPVRALSGGTAVDVGPRKQRLVLAVLLLEAGRLVDSTGLIRACWLDEPPPTAHRVIHAHLSRLRTALTGHDVALTRHGAGYVLEIDRSLVDAHRFRDLIRRAAVAGTDSERVALLERALGLWHGQPLEDVAAGETRQRLCGGLTEARTTAMQDRWDALLRLGRHRSILDELVTAAGEDPGQQRVTGQLMLALYRAGRAAEALETYRAYRRRLVDDYAIEPSGELRALETAILRGAPGLDAGHPPTGPTPNQLPPAVPGFTGRADALAVLDEVPAGATVVLSGPAGVGKTALAVNWAHRVRDRFPDGRLYVNLRGFDPDGHPVRVAEAMRDVLHALGDPHDRSPSTLNAQTGRYRSLIAGRKMLVLLDNARDAAQVRPLLPATPTATTLVTSRDRLTSLLAVEDACPLALDVLPPGEARSLLSRRLGARRTLAEPAAVATIVEACARLPLALSVAAARARASGFPLATLAAELTGPRGPLDALDGGDPSSDVRAVLASSLTLVSGAAARLFQLFGATAWPELTVAAAASLMDLPSDRVRPLLTELTRTGLLSEHAPGRFTCHALLRRVTQDVLLR